MTSSPTRKAVGNDVRSSKGSRLVTSSPTRKVGNDVRSSRLVTSSPASPPATVAPGKPGIAASISSDDVQAVKDAIATIRQKLSVLVSMTPAQIQATFKLGDARLPAALLALQTIQDNPGIVSPNYDAAGFQNAVDLFDVLTELQSLADQLDSDLNDTRIAVGGMIMQYALEAKKLVDANLKSTPGLKTVADKLSAFFAHATPAPAPAPAPAQNP